MRGAPRRLWRRLDGWLLAITFLALAVRLNHNLWVHPPTDYLYSDMRGYWDRSESMFDRPGERHAYLTLFPFGTHVLLFAVKAVFGRHNPAVIGIAWAVLGTAIVVFTYLLSRRLTARSVGRGLPRVPGLLRWAPRAVGFFAAIYYPFVSLGGYTLSEIPFAFCVTASALLGLRLADEGRRRDAWLLGLVFGLGATIRPQILASVALLGLFWLVRRRRLRKLRPALLARAAVPLAIVLALCVARTHYHTGELGFVATNDGVNFVFGRCHNTTLYAYASGGSGMFGPPPFYALESWSRRHPDSWVRLDPAEGLEIKFRGQMWDRDKLRAVAARCVKETGWERQARYAATHVVLLWGYNSIWPDSGQHPAFAKPIKRWGRAHVRVLLAPLIVALLMGLFRRWTRVGLVSMHVYALMLVAMLYFGDTRFRCPYDGVIIVLAAHAYARIVRWIFRRAWGALPWPVWRRT